MDMNEKKFPVERTAIVGGVVLVDPTTQKPYKSGVTIQQVDGGFDPTGLATDTGQDTIVAALKDVLAAVQANATNGEVSIVDDVLPPVSGGSTAAKQDAILAALQNLAAALGGTLKVSATDPVPVSATSLPLPAGSATASKQDAVLAALMALEEIFRTETLDVTGSVSVEGTVPVSGAVSLTNASIAVTPSGTFTVDVPGSATSAKQDAILSALGSLLTAIQAPQVVTDGGQSITVDGVVGVSGTIPVTDNGGSLTVDGTVGATQSGTWNVGLTGTPTVNVGNTVTISDGSGPLTVDGAVSATITGTPNVNISNTSVPVNVGNTVNVSDGNGSLTVDGAVSATITNTPNVNVSNTSLPVTQSGTWNVNATAANASTLVTSPTAVSVGTTSVQLTASTTGRKSVIIQNMGGTALYLSFAGTAVITAPTFIVPASNWIVIDRDTWTGVITAIRPSGSATSDAIVTVTN